VRYLECFNILEANCTAQPLGTTQGHPDSPSSEIYKDYAINWTLCEITWGLRQLIIGIQPFVPFTYGGLVEFLVLVEDALDTLGNDPIERYNATNQLYL